jgi:hypothetical protein
MARENAGISESEYEFVTEEDKDRIGCPKMVKKLVARASGSLVCFLGDDTIPQESFLMHALVEMAGLPDGWGLIGIDDQIRLKDRVKAPAHWLADKRLLPYLDGEFFHTGYRHCYCDNELADRCGELGRYKFSERSFVYHDHVIMDNDNDDADYQRVYSDDYLIHDILLYRKRRRNGWKGAIKNGG